VPTKQPLHITPKGTANGIADETRKLTIANQ
jgi:hypothetical protein